MFYKRIKFLKVPKSRFIKLNSKWWISKVMSRLHYETYENLKFGFFWVIFVFIYVAKNNLHQLENSNLIYLKIKILTKVLSIRMLKRLLVISDKNLTCSEIYVYIRLIYCQLNLLNTCNMVIRKLNISSRIKVELRT